MSTYRTRFAGTGETFALVVLKNLVLTFLTLGVYFPWAKTNRRRFVWGNTDFHGQRLVYTGTGKEIFIGYLKVIAFYVVWLGCLFGAASISKEVAVGVQLLGGLAIAVLMPYAIYWSRAYLLRSTRWRGIQAGLLKAGSHDFAKTFYVTLLLSVITFGLYLPIRGNRIYAVLIKNIRLGNLELKYGGSNSEAFKLFLSHLPLMVLTLGIYWFWYRAAVMSFRARNTSFGEAKGNLEITGSDYFMVNFINFMLLLFTGGLAFPWIVTRTMSFYLDHLSLEGAIELDQIVQRASEGSAFSDALADAIDATDLAL